MQAKLSPSASLHVSLEVPALDVSVVDGRPQELMLLTMDGLSAEYHAGNSAGVAYTQVLLRLNLAQLDDMLHGTSFPVVLMPASKKVAEDSAAEPLLFFTHVTQPARFRGALYTPTLVAHVAALRLQLSETLVWRMFAFAQALGTSGSSRGGGGSGPAATVSSASPGMHSAGGSRTRLAQAGSNSNLAGTAAAAGAGSLQQGSSPAGTSGGVQQVASADLPLQVRCSSMHCRMLLLPCSPPHFTSCGWLLCI